MQSDFNLRIRRAGKVLNMTGQHANQILGSLQSGPLKKKLKGQAHRSTEMTCTGLNRPTWGPVCCTIVQFWFPRKGEQEHWCSEQEATGGTGINDYGCWRDNWHKNGLYINRQTLLYSLSWSLVKKVLSGQTTEAMGKMLGPVTRNVLLRL